MIVLKVPKMGVNDETLNLISIRISNGSLIKRGEILVTFESSKTTMDFESENEGYFYCLHSSSSTIKVTLPFALISDNPLTTNQLASFKNEYLSKEIDSDRIPVGYVFTDKAKELFLKSNLDINLFPKNLIIKEKDVLNSISMNDDFSQLLNTYNEHDIVLVGGAGLLETYIEIFESQKVYRIVGIIHSDLLIGKKVFNIPVIGKQSESIFVELRKRGLINIFISFGSLSDRKRRFELYNYLKSLKFNIPNLIHPTVELSASAKLGDGIILLTNSVIGSNAKIGNCSMVLDGVIVSHDCVLHENVYLAPGCILAGYVEIGLNSLIGLGVTLYSKIIIGNNVIIQNGKNIFQDIPDGSIVK
jgi:sugar O-acyltransferase (sialic acid O-acetyltransferase NeuD family)